MHLLPEEVALASPNHLGMTTGREAHCYAKANSTRRRSGSKFATGNCEPQSCKIWLVRPLPGPAYTARQQEASRGHNPAPGGGLIPGALVRRCSCSNLRRAALHAADSLNNHKTQGILWQRNPPTPARERAPKEERARCGFAQPSYGPQPPNPAWSLVSPPRRPPPRNLLFVFLK